MAFSSDNSGGPMAEINVTPLVDVMLVLLIIFMITAPLMSHKVKVELPQANLKDRETNAPPVPPVTVAVQEDGSIYLSDEPVTKARLESEFAVLAQRQPQPQINIRGDKTTRYIHLREIQQIAQAQGMRKVGFVATKER